MLLPPPRSTLFPYTTLFRPPPRQRQLPGPCPAPLPRRHPRRARSEEHTSELQSLRHLVCRLLLEKKKENNHAAKKHDAIENRHTSQHATHCGATGAPVCVCT